MDSERIGHAVTETSLGMTVGPKDDCLLVHVDCLLENLLVKYRVAVSNRPAARRDITV